MLRSLLSQSRAFVAFRPAFQPSFFSAARLFSTIKYTKDHEYVKLETPAVGTIGISDYAQKQLGDVAYVELPEVGKKTKQGETFGNVDSVKSSSSLYSPVSGEVVEVNQELAAKSQFGLVNESAEDKGWMIKIKLSNPSELDKLMDKKAYDAFCSAEKH